jgi:hypothetical protein
MQRRGINEPWPSQSGGGSLVGQRAVEVVARLLWTF